MSEPAWTPGPWVARNIGEKENCYAIGVPDDEGYGDAVCFVEEGSHATGGSLHADAHLIAAAPEEDDALLAAVMWWEGVSALAQDSGRQITFGKDYEPSWIKTASAALAKARGEVPDR